MKLLIITSEKCNPDNILGSTFELSQAAILSRSYEVAILAVDPGYTLANKIKRLLRPAPARPPQRQPGFIPMLKSLLLRKSVINEYAIDGIDIIEGIGISLKSLQTFPRQLQAWVNAGMAGFETYLEKSGMPDIIHAHGRFLYAGVLALAIKEKYGIGYVYTEHSSYFRRGMVPPAAIPFCKKVFDGAAASIFVSQALQQEVEKVLQLRLPEARIVPNALDLLFEAPLSRRPGRREFIFTIIASLDHNKGFDILLDAFEEVLAHRADVYLNICGEGPMLQEIITTIAANKREGNIFLLGRKSREEVVRLLDGSDAFVLASRVETFGVAIVEAMSRGLPVVATRSGGPELILNESCGILVAPENAPALGGAMIEMLNRHEQFDGQQIREYALARFGSTHFLQTMENIYREI
jgi:teichuronic acid biosynthesis glycosyltransferase TuaC